MSQAKTYTIAVLREIHTALAEGKLGPSPDSMHEDLVRALALQLHLSNCIRSAILQLQAEGEE